MLVLSKVYDAYAKKLIPEGVFNSVLNNVVRAEECVGKVEEASQLTYPLTVVEPVLKLLYFKERVAVAPVYAYTSPYYVGDRIKLSVVVSAPLMMYASDRVLLACLAHELLHYAHLTLKFYELKYDQLRGGACEFYEGLLAFDDVSAVGAEELFRKSEWLTSTVKSVFKPMLRDEELDERTFKFWVDAGLPSVKIHPSEHLARISISDLGKLILDEDVVRRLRGSRASEG